MYGYGLRQFGNGTGLVVLIIQARSPSLKPPKCKKEEGDRRNSMQGGEWWEGGNVFGGARC